MGYDIGDDVYTPEFQINLINLVLRDRKVGSIYAEKLRPTDFKGFSIMWFAGTICEFYKKYSSTPTLLDLELLIRKAVKKGDISQKYIEEVLDVFESLHEIPSNVKFLKIQLGDFIKRGVLDDAIIQLSTARRVGEIDKAEKVLREMVGMMQIGSDLSVGSQFFSVDETKERVRNRRHGRIKAISTGTPMDRYLRNRGLNPGELGILVAPPNVGKTMGLIHFAKTAAHFGGKRVVFYTLEMDKDLIAQRFEASIFNEPLKDIEDRGVNISQKMSRWWRRDSDRLIIKEFATNTCTVNMIREHLDIVQETHGIVPDAIYIDYADIMKSDRRYERKHEELSWLYQELKNLAMERLIGVWSASQTNAKAVGKSLVDLNDLAGTFDKGKIGDVVITLCQTLEEAEDEKMRMFLAKNRGGQSKKIVDIETAFDRAQFCKRVS